MNSGKSQVAALVRYQWRAYWRRLGRARSLSASNQGIVLLILGIVLVKYLQLLNTASIRLSAGNTALLESVLIGISIACLFPLASGQQETTASRRLLHLPLSLKQLFAVRAISILIPPASWIIVAGSLAICYPLLQAKNPTAGIVSALLFIALSLLVGLTAAQLVSVARWRRVLMVTGFVLLIATTVYLAAGQQPRNLLVLTRFSPAKLVVNAARGEWTGAAIGILLTLLALAYLAAVWSFGESLEARTKSRAQKRRLFDSFRLPGQLGGLIIKDFRYFRRLLDPYLGVLVVILCAVHLVIAEAPSADVFRISILLVFAANSSVAFDLFGLDNPSTLDRYTLMPLTGRATLLSKNLAFALLIGTQVVPLFLLALWRLGLWITLGGMIEAAALAVAYLTWGNWMSVSQPIKMQFYRFSSSSEALADTIAGLIFGSLPGVVAIYGLRQGQRGILLISLVSSIFFALYVLSLVRFGKHLELRRERLYTALL